MTSSILNPNDLVSSYISDSSDYERDFNLFLEHTNQKKSATAWFENYLSQIDTSLCADFGCGNGAMFPVLLEHSQEVVGFDYNHDLVAQAREAFPQVTVHEGNLLELEPGMVLATFGLESHVKYYLPWEGEDREAMWTKLAAAELGMLATNAKMVHILQNGGTTYQGMIRDLAGEKYRFDMRPWAKRFAHKYGLNVDIQSTQAVVRTSDLEVAVNVARFMMNLIPAQVIDDAAITRKQLADYLLDVCDRDGNDIIATCDQDHIVFSRL